ncbi:MAG: FdhF/YdeP family oxidoreductase [Marinagarivorans sp.]|nr:FdhF/YdeP family oxidoreductase [Marinagarivorans sp.]
MSSISKTPTIVGGGAKKVLYTLNTVRKIGFKKAGKALVANNTCKACGLGMGGQRGGMTNELGEFPSVCNKSIQAQSTDIQPPIPSEIFAHSLDDLKALSAYELEHLGRLARPLYKAKLANKFTEVSWDWALDYAAQQFAACLPARSFFYASGRSSNEAGFLLQLFARAYGTNNINNCSYYCHQATGVGLGATIGSGTATVELADLALSDCIIVIGANPASNHPRFIHQLKNCRDRGGQVIVINPAKEPGLVKFAVPKSPSSMIAGGTEIASLYIQPNIGGDLAVLTGVAKALFEMAAIDEAFIANHCDDFAGYQAHIKAQLWLDIEEQSGLTRAEIEALAAAYAAANNAIFAWGMGITHHVHGVQNVEAIANLALLRGMIGRQGAGLLPLRGHSNVQGIGTVGVKPVLASEVLERIEQTYGIELPQSQGLDTFASLKAAEAGAIDCALLLGGNLYSASPNTAWAGQALNNIAFKMFMTTTLNAGHIEGAGDGDVLILPVCARDEEPEPTTQESMFSYVRLSDGGITRIAEARSEVAILADLAQRLMPHSPIDFAAFKRHQKCREAIASFVPGLAELKDIAVAKQEFHVQNRLLHSPVFNTSNQKARFKVHSLVVKAPNQDFPFTLATLRSEGQFNSIIYESTDSYRYNAARNAVLMSPEDLVRMGLATGDVVDVRSADGEMLGMVVQAFDLPAGNCLAYYPEANQLTGQAQDPQSLTPAFKSVSVAISRPSI